MTMTDASGYSGELQLLAPCGHPEQHTVLRVPGGKSVAVQFNSCGWVCYFYASDGRCRCGWVGMEVWESYGVQL